MARSILGVGFILTLYLFISEILPQVDQRKMSILMVTLGGGLGWLMILSGIPILATPPPLEFYSPEAFSFLMLLTLPHLLLARIFLFLSLKAFLHRQFLWSGLILILLCLIQPADVILFWAVISLYTLINWISSRDISYAKIWESLRPVLIVITISAPVLGYIAYLFVVDPIWNQWSTQNVIASPNPFHFLLSYGPYLLFSVFGLKELKQQHFDFWRLSVAWIILIPILIYIPVGFQRRLIDGFQIPLVILAAFGLTSFTKQFQKWLIPSVLTMLIPSSLILITGATISVLNPTEPAFRPVDEIAIYKWLEKNARSNEVLLGSYPTGNILPAYTSLIPFIGHSVETAYFKEKMALVVAFYQTETSDIERQSLIQERRIDYVFFGPHEKELGELDPSNLPYLVKRFEQGDYSVYEVIR